MITIILYCFATTITITIVIAAPASMQQLLHLAHYTHPHTHAYIHTYARLAKISYLHQHHQQPAVWVIMYDLDRSLVLIYNTA